MVDYNGARRDFYKKSRGNRLTASLWDSLRRTVSCRSRIFFVDPILEKFPGRRQVWSPPRVFVLTARSLVNNISFVFSSTLPITFPSLPFASINASLFSSPQKHNKTAGRSIFPITFLFYFQPVHCQKQYFIHSGLSAHSGAHSISFYSINQHTSWSEIDFT